jgi:hypothetical protein
LRVLLAALCGFLTLCAGCTNIWVAPTGLDTNPGTEAQPKRTLQGACAAASDGNRVITMKTGSYPEQALPAGCGPGSVVESGGDVLIRAQTPSTVSPTLDVDASDMTLTGLDVDSRALARKAMHIDGDRVTFKDGQVGNTVDNKAIEIWGDDVVIRNTRVHDARIASPDAHMEGIFIVSAQRPVIENNVFERNAIYDVAVTRCTWCSPELPAGQDGRLVGNTFGRSHQCCDLSSWHYSEVAFYPVLPEVRGWTVRDNWFETRADDPSTPANEIRGGVQLQAPWNAGVRCGNTEGPAQGVIGAEWKQPC